MNRSQFACLCGVIVGVVGTSCAMAEPPPKIVSVAMRQDSHRRVTVDYELAVAPAIITLDIQTNDANGVWSSIGGEHIQRVTGDCWKRVDVGAHTIRWDPSADWPGHRVADGGARAVVKAWALDNPPDYLVVDISSGAQPKTQRYYPSEDFLPGGLLANADYRTTSLVLRKIMAKDVTWTMGSANWGNTEKTHKVTMSDSYYIGVFPITQRQWEIPEKDNDNGNFRCSYFNNVQDYAMRPVERVSYYMVRKAAGNWNDTTVDYPADPAPTSYLGMLRTRTGLAFDLPTEAQWEYAARAGDVDGRWGNGAAVLVVAGQDDAPDANLPGRYLANGGYADGAEPAQDCSAENGTAVVGSYAPNHWGLYDMAGNVWEWCLGGYVDDNLAQSDGAAIADNGFAVVRGGSWSNKAFWCRLSARWGINLALPDELQKNFFGLRVVCPVAAE